MNDYQREQIKNLRHQGLGYKRVAMALELPVDTIKSFCRKNQLTGVMAKPNTDVSIGFYCKECGKELRQEEKKKQLKFCSATCRDIWWRKHRNESKKGKAKVISCKYCGKEFLAYQHEKRKYCSHECYVTDRFKGGEHHE
ncbi:hypothetical protein [Pseudolactococcus insecticola]|uniref:RNA polymerase subunit sigma-70 n=1 Tax=Pseudolactococcus insecticola TaxID=2709158 RepID=A0A6A0B6U7_9LACT|nr:hypothetical protein [Lactococcus insecticola]GFH40221.1 hypothetical protein Hs20B_06190 [Lactococcus insecticola]